MGRSKNRYDDELQRTLQLIRKYHKTRPLLVLPVLEQGIDNVDFTGSAIHVKFFNDGQSTYRPEESTLTE